MLCATSKLVGNLLRDCDVELTAGVKELLYIGHTSQIATITRDPTNRKIITSIVLKAGEKLSVYNYQAPKGIKPSTGFEETEAGNKLPQTVVLPIISNSPEAKLQVEAMVNATDLFIIFKREGTFADWHEYGINNGMKCTGFVDDPNDATYGGAMLVTLTNPNARGLSSTIRHQTSGSPDTDTFLAGIANAVS